MDNLDTMAPQVDLQDQQGLAEVIQSSKFTSILVGLTIVVLAIGLLRFWLSKSSGRSLLLLGPSGSGKTTLFYQLKDGNLHNGTVASMQENVGIWTAGQVNTGSAVQLVDIPGHAKVRSRFESYIQDARGVVYVVDSVDFMGQKTAVAEQLLEVLRHPYLRKRRLPTMVACNKSDEGAKAHTVDFIRKRLEREIDELRRTQSTLEDSGGAEATDILGNAEEQFTFDALLKKNGTLVSAAACSALKGDLLEITSFIGRTMRV